MVAEVALQFCAPNPEDVLHQNRGRKVDEASERRYEAAAWLRKLVGVVGAKNLPAEPSEEDFRLGLRTGVILCNVLNKVQPGSVPKPVLFPTDFESIPDGAALSTCQYFENVRNFLAALEKIGIPIFEVSDLEKGGNLSGIVDSVLALKSYSEWKQKGSHGVWKCNRNSLARLNSIKSYYSRSSSNSEMSVDCLSPEQLFSCDLLLEFNEMGDSQTMHALVHDLISDKKQEEIPSIVQNMLTKVATEFEQRLAMEIEQLKASTRVLDVPVAKETLVLHTPEEIKVVSPTKHELVDILDTNESLSQPSNEDIEDKVVIKTEDKVEVKIAQEAHCTRKHIDDDEVHVEAICTRKHVDDNDVQAQFLKQKMIVAEQHRNVETLKLTLSTAKADVHLLTTKYQEEVRNLGKQLFGLAHAASNYQKVLEENRKLYNQVQDLKGSIRVYCRVRPFLPTDPNRATTVDNAEDRSITIATPSKSGKDAKKSFTFNKVFGPSASQGEVFADTQPLIRSVLDGFNVCIFAYGQTGAGKTYTMSGPDDLTEENMGVNYRALNDLFYISEQRKNVVSYEISVQMTEIYNEQVRDLLATDGAKQRLEIRNSSQKGTNTNANLVPVASTNEVIDIMNLGMKNRAVSATAMNGRSSRSHSCLTIHVQGRDLTSGSILRGCLHLVDLAGSERVDKSEVVGDRLKEAQHINKSLAALGDVISALAQKNAHVPYRNSKLTQLLQDSLGGQAKTLMFVHISPEHEDVGETISTLKFAERVSTVELGAAKANKEGGSASSSEVKDLREQIANLKAALARKEGELGSSPSLQSSRSLGSTQSKEDVGAVEIGNNFLPRRKSFDLQDMINSPPSPMSISSNLRILGSDSSLKDLSSEEFSSPARVDTSETTNQESLDNSDNSDPETIISQLSAASTPPKRTTPSKLKKPTPTPRQAKTPELRNIVPPTRKLSSGAPSPLPKNGKLAPIIDMKRKSGGRVK